VRETAYQRIPRVSVPGVASRRMSGSAAPIPARVDRRPARLGHRLADIAMIPGSGPVQRKIKILATGETFGTVVGATAKVTDNCTPLAAPLTSANEYTLKAVSDMRELALGRPADVLLPKRHVIGEFHNASEFGRISGEWPGVATMAEGVYTTTEDRPQLPTQVGASHATFAQNFQAQGSATLPLENFHAAAYARLTAFLLCWNEFRADPTTGVALFQRKTADFANLYNAYANVASGVYVRGVDNTWHGLWASYAGPIEEAYGKMYKVISSSDARAAMDKVEAINAAVDSAQPIPRISQTEFTKVQSLAGAMFPAVSAILTASMATKPGADAVKAESDNVDAYAGGNAATLRMSDQGTALVKAKAVRELFMGQQIRTLPQPGLVKVGKAHIAGLTGQHIPDALLYDDAGAFDTAIRKGAADL